MGYIQGHQKARTKQRCNTQKTITPPPYTMAIQLTESIIDIGLSLIPSSSTPKNRHKNERFNVWSICSTSSKDLLFLSFQIIHKMHKGATLHAFFLLFPKKDPCKLERAPLIEACITHSTPNKEKTNCNEILVLVQWSKRRSTYSSSSLHKENLFTMFQPHFFS